MRADSCLVQIVFFCSFIRISTSAFIHPYILDLFKHKTQGKVWTFTDPGDHIGSSIAEDRLGRDGCSQSMANWIELQSLLMSKELHITETLWRFSVEERRTRQLTCSDVAVTVQVNFTGSGTVLEVSRNVHYAPSGALSQWIEVDLGKDAIQAEDLRGTNRTKVFVRTRVRCVNVSDPCPEGSPLLPFSLEDLRRVEPVQRRYRYRKQPLLAVVETNAAPEDGLNKALQTMATRRRRDALLSRHSRSTPRPRPPNCQLEQYLVDTAKDLPELKIVLPKKFNLGLCKGVCPFTAMQGHKSGLGATNHALVATRLAYTYPSADIPIATCVPASYEHLHVILDGGNNSFLSQVYAEVKATRCACR